MSNVVWPVVSIGNRIYELGDIGASETISIINSNYQSLTLSEASTITIADGIIGYAQSLILVITGNYNVTWVNIAKSVDGILPDLENAPSSTMRIRIDWNGSEWHMTGWLALGDV